MNVVSLASPVYRVTTVTDAIYYRILVSIFLEKNIYVWIFYDNIFN